MSNIRKVFDEQTIEKEISKLAQTISRDYQGKELVLICVLKGAFIFTAKLMSQLTIPCKIEFIKISSYGDSQKSSGVLKIKGHIVV